MNISEERIRACTTLLAEVREITGGDSVSSASLEAIKARLVLLGQKTELFPRTDFSLPVAQGRNHVLLAEPDDGYGLYLTINLPGKIAAPHDHGIWCVNAAVSGRERHELYRRTDDGTVPGHASIEKTGEVIVEPGTGLALADHDIHATEVVGDDAAIALALYGYALTRFPSVLWYQPKFGSVRAMPSRRAVSPR